MSLPVNSDYLSLEKIARYRHACSNGSPYATNKPIDIKPRARRGYGSSLKLFLGKCVKEWTLTWCLFYIMSILSVHSWLLSLVSIWQLFPCKLGNNNKKSCWISFRFKRSLSYCFARVCSDCIMYMCLDSCICVTWINVHRVCVCSVLSEH